MKTIIFGMMLLMSQISLAGESCNLDISVDGNAMKVTARLLDKPGEYVNIPLEGNQGCSDHFLSILKEGQKFTEIDGLKIPIEYQYSLNSSESDSFFETVSTNAKIGGFEVVLSDDASTIKAMAKDASI